MQVKREFNPKIARRLQSISERKLARLLQVETENHNEIPQRQAQGLKENSSSLTIKEALDKLRASNPFRAIKDPAAWQQEIRQDRAFLSKPHWIKR